MPKDFFTNATVRTPNLTQNFIIFYLKVRTVSSVATTFV